MAVRQRLWRAPAVAATAASVVAAERAGVSGSSGRGSFNSGSGRVWECLWGRRRPWGLQKGRRTRAQQRPWELERLGVKAITAIKR